MPMLHAIRSYAEFTGDSRIVPFFTRFFRYGMGWPYYVKEMWAATPDNGTVDRSWRFIPDGKTKLQATHTGKVLAISNMSTANGAQLTQWPATGTADHVWRFADAGSGYFRVYSEFDGKCVEISGGSTADGARATQWDYLGGAHQQWRLASAGVNVFALVAKHSSKVLEVAGQSGADGAPVGQWVDVRLANQRWRIVPG